MKKRTSISRKMQTIVLLPILLLGLGILFFGIVLIYGFASNIVRNEVETTTYLLKGCFDLSVRGDYSYEDGMLKKGDINITDSTMLYQVKNNANIDTTIFWGDTRILTTVENEYGVSAIKTKANSEVKQRVLENGENYFSNRLNINGSSYIGYYTPLKNDDDSIVGMVFAGKPASMVYQQIGNIMVVFLAFSIVAIVVALVVSKRFSQKMIGDIGLIKQYLHVLSDGDLSITIDERVVNRTDELGEIGVYADKVSSALKNLIELDALTSLYNRRSCHNHLRALIKQDCDVTFVMCDIDWFKSINDQYGHECGDYILVGVSEMLQESVKDCGFASRWGGEEFLLVYRLGIQEAKEKTEKLLLDLREKVFTYQEQTIHITMTFGIKEMEKDVPYEEVIKAADDNLYKGKKAGRNQVVC
ncbi:MAG: diguanylate cyclase [Lachnospiraceae bacterium]|nr:diguanylate cyclase [Lachnospiraceae bacterium]MDE6626209.1 diguanylate cyclase [Lachnospiraceae bacterium]